MKKRYILLILAGIIMMQGIKAQNYSLDNGTVSVTFSFSSQGLGLELTSLRYGNHEALADTTSVFTLIIKDLSNNTEYNIGSRRYWGAVDILTPGDTLLCRFANPTLSYFPPDLEVVVKVWAVDAAVHWKMEVSGIDQTHGLMRMIFPDMILSAPGNDYFLIPKYSGVVVDNPMANQIDFDNFYPRGWGWTMPWMAYYGADYGLYLGAHDPLASYKDFSIEAETRGLHYKTTVPAKDMGQPGNDQVFPGEFVTGFFQGDWYDAAMVYRHWAEENAVYWPVTDSVRYARQHKIGEIGAWAYISEDTTVSMARIAYAMNRFKQLFDSIPAGFLWSRWNYEDFDDNYPDYFPERDSTDWVLREVQDSGRAYITPYINGRLYDTDLPDYPQRGYPNATKDETGQVFTQTFNSNAFAVMCPAQPLWQDTLAYAVDQLTNRLGASGVYVDQVCAAGPKLCMDTTHLHTAGGGHYWHDGYDEMFGRFHQIMPHDGFITTEGAADFIANQVDGFLTLGWTTANMVPAHQAVYSGRVQYYGLALYSSQYHDEAFYTKLAQGLTTGIQPGQFYCYFADDPNADLARPYVQDLVRMRYRLRDYLSYGRLLRPLQLPASIPNIQTVWYEGDIPVNVSIKAVQNGVFALENGESVVVLFVNASMTDAYDFSFDFNGSDYGLSGNLFVREVFPDHTGAIEQRSNAFTQTVHLNALETKAYQIGTDSTFAVAKNKTIDFPFRIFPNPAKNFWQIRSDREEDFQWRLYDLTGKMINQGKSKNRKARVHVPEGSQGVWIMEIRWKGGKRGVLVFGG